MTVFCAMYFTMFRYVYFVYLQDVPSSTSHSKSLFEPFVYRLCALLDESVAK